MFFNSENLAAERRFMLQYNTATCNKNYIIFWEACMNNKYIFSILMILILFNSLLIFACVASVDAQRMSKEELRSRLGDRDIVIIDVRQAYDWEMSDSKIRGAVREGPQDVTSWAKKYSKEKTIVLYCA